MPADPQQIDALRRSSREMVRELGFTRVTFDATGLTHTRCHALIEIDRGGSIGVLDLAAILRLDKASASRVVRGMMSDGLIATSGDPSDARRRVLSLTTKGRRLLARVHHAANEMAGSALSLLSPAETTTVLDGIALYVGALVRARARARCSIRSIARKDDPAIAAIIRQVMTEYGATGEGFAIHDAEVDSMSRAYAREGAAYFVVARDGKLVGGGGFAPLEGGAPGTCELRKMYFLPEARGLGLGHDMLERCLASAAAAGFRRCYLETLGRMSEARRLYERAGFRPIAKPKGNTGHFGCDAWYEREL